MKNLKGQAAIERPSVTARSMKGQAAIEYIMTYGWAILALVIVLGILFGSGILNPTYLVSEECDLGSNFPCNFIVFNQAGETKISMEIYNGFPYEIEIIGITVEEKDTGSVFTGLGGGRVDSGDKITMQGTLPDTELASGSMEKFGVTLNYVSCAPEVSEGGGCSASEHTISGKIVARIVSE